MTFHIVNERMREDRFWQIIEQSLEYAKQEADSYEDQQEPQMDALENILCKLNWQEIISFHNRFEDYVWGQIYNGTLRCAAYLVCEKQDYSDDIDLVDMPESDKVLFWNFYSWLISRGKKVYTDALANADSIADLVAIGGKDFSYEFEDFNVSGKVLDKHLGVNIEKFCSHDRSASNWASFDWEDNPERMKQLLPRLYDMYCES